MRIRSATWCTVTLLFSIGMLGTTATADSTAPSASPVKVAQATGKASSDAAAAKPQTARQKCVARCEMDNGRCNSDVRRSRQECSKKAANNGNNPFTGRPDDAYCGYFSGDHCSYYSNRNACGQRFVRRYAECVDWMRGNIASQRFDCFKAETKAQGLCRAELQDCQAACQ